MKMLIAIITLFVILTGCAAKQENAPANNSPSTTEAAATRTETPTPTPSPVLSQTTTTERPVDFTYLGATPDREHIQYRIKVNTEKPISQVDLSVKYVNDDGKIVDETTYVWQNIVHSRRTPIEKGKSYDVTEILPVGATKAEMALKRVVFADNTYWNAK